MLNFVTKVLMMHHLLMGNSQSIVHRVIIQHVPPSVNLWRHDDNVISLSGSVMRTKLIETEKYFVLNAEFHYKSVHGVPFIDE